jgi:hypothetical protein
MFVTFKYTMLKICFINLNYVHATDSFFLNISASSGAKMIKIRVEMTSQYFFEICGFI